MTRADRDENRRASDRINTERHQEWNLFEGEQEEVSASQSRHGSLEVGTSPDRPSGLELRQANLGRKARLAEQGWVEKHGRHHGGRITSWSIRRMNPETPPKASEPAVDNSMPKPQKDAPAQTNGKDNKLENGFKEVLKKSTGNDPTKIGSLPAEEHIQLMEERAKKNSYDTGFRARFAAMLAKHDGKKFVTNGGNTNLEACNYDADTSNLSEIGGENDISEDRIMAGISQDKRNYSTLEARFTEEMAKGMSKNNPARSDQLDRDGSNNDADMSGFETVPRGSKKRGSRNDAIHYDDGDNPVPRVARSYTQRRVANRQIKERDAFNERFKEILAKHDGKKNQINDGKNNQTDDGKTDFEMGYKGTMIDTGNNQSGKRKRDVKNEDELMDSMQHIPASIGRKRSRNVDRADFPLELAMERTRFSPERRRDRSPPKHSVDRWGRPLGNSYRAEFSPGKRPVYDGMKGELDLYRSDRNVPERDRYYRSPEPPYGGRSSVYSERDRDFISFSDPLDDGFDSRRGERTQGRYWKGFHQDNMDDRSTFRGIMEDVDEFKESKKQQVKQEYGGDFRRRSPSPRSNGQLPEIIPLNEETDEQGEWWGTERKLGKRYQLDKVKGTGGRRKARGKNGRRLI